MEMQEFRTEFKEINSKQILIDEDYQRQVDYNRVRKMVANYNPNLVNPIKVSYRDKRYYCFDGQHTLSMLKALNDNKDTLVPCKVYYNMDETDEARLFSEQNGISRAVKSNQKLKSLYVAGDIDVIEFRKAVESLGIKCDFSSGGANRKLICYSTAFRIFMRHDGKHLKRVLSIILDAWDGESESFSNEIIQGIDLFLRTYGDEIKTEHLVKRLKKTTPVRLKREVKDVLVGGAKRYAIPIFNAYNKNTSNNRLEYKF
jgi:hypothetical protein